MTTIQDLGRRGYAHLGVTRAGALDDRAAALANRLVGNDESAAVLEVMFGGFEMRATAGRWVAVTGAPCPVILEGRSRGHSQAEWLPAGATLRLGPPSTGVRSYVAVAGGIAVEPVLGSRSTDTLAWVGPPRVADGVELPVGPPLGPPVGHDTPRTPTRGPLRISPGPRDDWFGADAVDRLCEATYVVEPESNRIGLRLGGPPLTRIRADELASEGMVHGAVQLPPSGTPVVFLADCPTTGGYPVIGVVHEDDLWQCGQLRPGEEIRFTRDSAPESPRA